jgi:hypothetical protein
MFGSEVNQLYGLDDIDFGAEEVKDKKPRLENVVSQFDLI